MASQKSKFVDANVVLEVLLERTHVQQAAEVLLQKNDYHISALTGHLVYHFCRNYITRHELTEHLKDFTLDSLTSDDFEWAHKNGADFSFEDALQVAVAIREGCTEFITFDQKLIKLINKQGIIKARSPR